MSKIQAGETQAAFLGTTESVSPVLTASKPKLWARVRPIFSEPIVHFLILGTLVFALSEGIEHYQSQYRVVIGADVKTRLADTFRQQYGSLPNDKQLQVLVDNYVKEEVLYRESLALDLQKGDEIVRRRLVQKINFLQQDLANIEPPSTSALQTYYQQHVLDYSLPLKRSFTQIYFSPDVDSDAQAKQRAEAVLTSLQKEPVARAPERGAPFPGTSDVAELDQASAERLFGTSDLSAKLYSVPVNTWVGPYKSGFGWHLVRITAEKPAQVQPYTTVAQRVLQDFQDAHRNDLNQQAYAEIRKKYRVEIAGSSL